MNSAEMMALADRLEAHNRWRRYVDGEGPPMLEPRQLGRDLEDAIRFLRLAALRDDPRHLWLLNMGGSCNSANPVRDPVCPACRDMMAIEAAR